MLSYSTIGLVACGLAVAGAFSTPPAFSGAKPLDTHQRMPLKTLRHEGGNAQQRERSTTLSMVDSPAFRDTKSRRQVLLSAAGLAASPLVSKVAYAEEDETVCKNPLGCEIPKQLAPPKKVYKGVIGQFNRAMMASFHTPVSLCPCVCVRAHTHTSTQATCCADCLLRVQHMWEGSVRIIAACLCLPACLSVCLSLSL